MCALTRGLYTRDGHLGAHVEVDVGASDEFSVWSHIG